VFYSEQSHICGVFHLRAFNGYVLRCENYVKIWLTIVRAFIKHKNMDILSNEYLPAPGGRILVWNRARAGSS
jgi:hypothetical protein